MPCALLAAGFFLLAAGCSGMAGNTRADTDHSSAAKLYQAGHAAMQQGEYKAAMTQFRTLELEYPGDILTAQGQMELIYAYYKQDEPAAVVATAERFIREHPDHANLDYVYYLRGLAVFGQAEEVLTRESPEIRPKPPAGELAMEYFSALIARFPGSRYSDDARNRILHLQNMLAVFELGTAKKYLNRGDYTNAGLYARAVMENYPDSTVKMEAATLANMAYRMLNLEQSPPSDAPAATAAPAPESGSGARREDWIAQQDPHAYTLQLMSVTDQAALLNFIRQHPLKDLAYFTTARAGNARYSLIYGVYSNTQDARAAAEKLTPSLRQQQPWIRQYGDIQAIIAADRAPAGGAN